MKNMFLSLLTLSLSLFTFGQLVTKQHISVVIPGNYADPSIMRDGDTFYMTHTSLEFIPGLLIWESKDLVNWSPVAYALDTLLGPVWAPELVKHKGRFYIYFPVRGKNFVVYADDIRGPWSKPQDIGAGLIDPGHIATPDGDRYLHLSGGHAVKLNRDGTASEGVPKKVYAGWDIPDDYVVECFCLESPKLFKKDGYYYLVSAQGGTAGPATSHMAVMARSESPLGPWKNSPYNPVIRTWSLHERWWSKGHATLFDDPDGNWYAIYHAFDSDFLAHGRQVLIEPVKWTHDGWAVLKRNYKKEPVSKTYNNLNIVSDNFESSGLHWQWQFLGFSELSQVVIENGALKLESPEGKMRSANIRHGDVSFEATVKLYTDENPDFGLAIMYNSSHFAGIGGSDGKVVSWVKGRPAQITEVEIKHPIWFRIRNEAYNVSVSYSTDGMNWVKLERSFEVLSYQHNMLGGFSSLILGIFTRGHGTLYIDDFTYKAIEP